MAASRAVRTVRSANRGSVFRAVGWAALLASISVTGCGLATQGTGTGELSPGGAAGASGGGTSGTAGSAAEAGTGGVAGEGTGGTGGSGPPFPAGFEPIEVNVPDGYLCEIPDDYMDQGGDPVRVPCGVEADRFSDRDPQDLPSEFRLVTWNVQLGMNSSEVVMQLQTHPELLDADFILLQEVARHDRASEPDLLNQARQIAQALQMDYVFAVEWDRRLDGDGLGEIGSAVLSKYPLGNVTQIRHVPKRNGWGDKRHYGGIATLAVDAAIGMRRVRFYSAHLDNTFLLVDGRAVQAAEIRDDANLPDRAPLQIVAGDLATINCTHATGANCTQAPDAELAVRQFLDAGWSDGTKGYTGHTQVELLAQQRLDFIFYRHMVVRAGKAAVDARGSDHFPLYFDFAVDL